MGTASVNILRVSGLNPTCTVLLCFIFGTMHPLGNLWRQRRLYQKVPDIAQIGPPQAILRTHLTVCQMRMGHIQQLHKPPTLQSFPPDAIFVLYRSLEASPKRCLAGCLSCPALTSNPNLTRTTFLLSGTFQGGHPEQRVGAQQHEALRDHAGGGLQRAAPPAHRQAGGRGGWSFGRRHAREVHPHAALSHPSRGGYPTQTLTHSPAKRKYLFRILQTWVPLSSKKCGQRDPSCSPCSEKAMHAFVMLFALLASCIRTILMGIDAGWGVAIST